MRASMPTSCTTRRTTTLTTPDERATALALTAVPGLGPVRIGRLVAELGGVVAALQKVVPDDRERVSLVARASAMLEACARRGIGVVTLAESHYPSPLRDLEDAPAALYTLGALSLTQPPAVALVGSRQATSYGRQVARDFARRLASRGICVVSGLAAGIDAEAHAAALAAGGPTIAVQGTGVDVAYPRSNAGLHAQIARDGLIVSELPPGRPAHPGAFPRRNRIIAALADVVVVVEAGVRSGALITAQLGGTLGRSVAAVPGPIDSESSRGANQLLRDGAQTLASFDDVLGLLALTRRGRGADTRADDVTASGSSHAVRPCDYAPDSAEGRLLAVLANGPRGTDDLVRACGISPRDVATALSTLELQGEVLFDPSGLVRAACAPLLTSR